MKSKLLRAGVSTAALALCVVGCAWAQERVAAVLPGDPFPAATFNNLNTAAGGPETVDLARVIGKKPVLFVYWIPRNDRAEQMLGQVQALVEEVGPDRVALYGVAIPRPGLEAEVIAERAKALEIRVPILEDAEFVLGQQLSIQAVPSLGIVDAEGRLRLTNGASLVQVLGYKTDLAAAVRKVAASGSLMTYGRLERYYPVTELQGRDCPDFKAPLLATSVEQRWHSLLDEGKVNVLIFWSIDCPHCRKSLPEIDAWIKQHPEGINVYSAAAITNETNKTKTREFCDLNGFGFPTLVDKNAEIGKLYKVTTTPTIVIIGPNGVVDSVITSGYSDFGARIEEKKRALLGSLGG